MKRTLFVAAVCLTLGLSACASGGKNYDPAAVSQIAVGTPIAEVIARLGEPNSRINGPDGSTNLVWIHTRVTGLGTVDSRSALLVFDPNGRFVRVASTTQQNIR